MPSFDDLGGAGGLAPRGMGADLGQGWMLLHGTADLLIAATFCVIALGIVFYLRRRRRLLREYRVVAALFASFIVAVALTHLLGVIGFWYPVYGLEGLAKAVTAILAIVAIALIWPLLPALVRLPSSGQLAEANDSMRREAEAHESTLRELAASQRELESRVQERTAELQLMNLRFKTALRGAKVYLFSQDRDLRYDWVYSPEGDDASVLLGRTDDEVLPAPERDFIVAAKRQVIASGKATDIEVSSVVPERRALFALRVDPIAGANGQVEGIICAAIDIARIRSLESEQRRLSDELGAALQRYETALRGSHVTVFTQDRDLRYSTVSGPVFGRRPDEIVGGFDDMIAEPHRAPFVRLKREVLASGESRSGEFHIPDAGGGRWYDIHMEALRDAAGGIVGLTGAAVDVSSRKADEAHLRELMRELTHRSKNLLAVIQAMARQTARHSSGIDKFLEQFSARVQALSASHDLLVQENWHGASLEELVRSQLGQHLEREKPQVSLRGPALLLKPEAAQSLGLAMHELTANAAKYGALSVPGGHVDIEWRHLEDADDAFEILWAESDGPPVPPAQHNGFGRLVIERNLTRTLNAAIDLSFPSEGVRCRMLVPSANLASVAGLAETPFGKEPQHAVPR